MSPRTTLKTSGWRACLRPQRARRPSCQARVASVERPSAVVEDAAADPDARLEDPWEDSKWTGVKWTVYRGTAYDLTSFMDRHPAGSWLLNLAIGRDCTALFESYHLRPDVAAARLQRLPVLEGFPIAAVPKSPRPNDSELYCSIRERVRSEVFRDQDGVHRTGSEWAAAVILGYTAAALTAYVASPGLLTGAAFGLGGAWVGLTVQHCGNHGAMSTSPLVNALMGLCNDVTGGSSLIWRYHHQVSHHIHCNDDGLDEDVFSSFPLLRFDPRLPRYWFHAYQHVYMWFTFPVLQLAFQVGDLLALAQNRTAGATLYGASAAERGTVLLGKLVHFSLLWGLPAALHGWAATVPAAAAYVVMQSLVLATTFAVSHNVPETKPAYSDKELGAHMTESNLTEAYDTRDWGVQQVLTSANWGGVVGNFMTGGLNLQIEHHLFPAISFMHYPAIARIVQDECSKRNVPYASYDTLPQILTRFVRYMKEVGAAEERSDGDGKASTSAGAGAKELVARL